MKFVIVGFLVFLSSISTAQTVVYTEPFDNTSNITVNPGGTFSYCASSGTCASNDIFNVTNSTNITNCVTGETGFIFAMIDQDACDVDNSFIIIDLINPASNDGLLAFNGQFAVLGDLLDLGDNFVVQYSVDGGVTYTTATTFTQSSGTTYTNSSLTLNSTFKNFGFNIGYGYGGVTVKIKITFNTGGGNAEGAALDEFQLIHTPACTPPSIQASNLNVSLLSTTSYGLSWLNGNGDKTLVTARLKTTSGVDPVNGSAYTANSVFGSGNQTAVGSLNYVIYNGTGASCSVTGLSASSLYTFSVYSYNSATNCYLLNELIGSPCYVDNNSNTGDVYTASSVAGNNSANGTASNPYATLTYALSIASAGDMIFVDAGTYTDNALSSTTGGGYVIGAGITKTIFNNPSADSYFMRIDDNNSTVSDMTLRDYNAQTCGTSGGQVLGVLGATGVRITNVLIDQASTSSDGCGYPIEVRAGASVVFQGGGATCNNWFAGGGIHVSGATTSATINNYLFYGNRKDTQNGSALHVDDGTVVVRNSKFDNNESRSDKRGAGIFQQGGTVSVYDSWFDQNETWLAYDQPGGTILISGGTFTIKRSKFTNHTQGGGSTSYGAAIGITSGTATIDSCYFSANSGSVSRGRDLYNDGGAVTVRNCTFLSGVNQIGSNSGTMSLSNSGSPSASLTTGLTFINTTAPSYTANPTVPQFTGVCGSITILPVELLNFEGTCENTHTHLWWSTASEHNNDYFTIDRAGSNGVFYELAKVNGKMNTTQQSEYNFADYYAEEGVNYYRLFQTDVDGQSRELKTISVYNNCLTGSGIEVSASFNSMDNSITVGYNFDRDQMVHAALYNSLGQMVQTTDLFLDASERKAQIDLNETLSFGIYFLKLSNDEFMVSEKILISK